jgi:hypothetical protein
LNGKLLFSNVLNIDFLLTGVLIPDCSYRAWNNYVPALFDSVKLNYPSTPFSLSHKQALSHTMAEQAEIVVPNEENTIEGTRCLISSPLGTLY